jgi:hypothetical protein
MKDILTLGSAPWEEDCVQVESSGTYLRPMLAQCQSFKQLLLDIFGKPPEGASLVVRQFPHDFGTYAEVCVVFDDRFPEAVTYAYKLEANTPAEWSQT